MTTTAGPAPIRPANAARYRGWPVILLAVPAFVAIWSGWVGLGGLTGFGVVRPLPGIWDEARLNTAITLPIGVETYAAYALHVWLSGHQLPDSARRFAKWSAIGSLLLGAAGQVAYHLMDAAHMTRAPWQITTLVACLPVAVLGMGAALAHLVRAEPASARAEQAREATPPAVDAAPVDVPAPRPARRAVRTATATDTGTAISRTRARHPDWTVGQIAARVGVSDRTVRRHLNTTTNTSTTDGTEAAA
jgi:AraC-like DNA-binding protein